MNIKIKREMNALDLLCVLKEIKPKVLNSYFNNAYHLAENFFLFKFRGEETLNLLFEAGKRIHLTKFDFEKPRMPSPLCTFIRKNFNRCRVVYVSQYDFDRVLTLKVATKKGDHSVMILELVGNGNLIVTDSSLVIRTALKRLKMRDRSILPGESYKFPPLRGFNPLEVQASAVLDFFKSFRGNVAQALTRALNLSGELAEEVCARANVDKSRKAKSLEISEVELILQEFSNIIDSIREGCLNPQIILDEDGNVVSVTPIDFKIYENFRAEYFETCNEALDEYFSRLAKYEEEELREKVRREVEGKFKAILEKQFERLSELESEALKYRGWADLIMSNLDLAQRAIDWVNGLVKSGASWGEVARHVSRIEDEFLAGVIDSFDPKGKVLYLRINGQVVPLSVQLSAAANASSFYDKAKGFLRRAERARAAIDEVRLKIESEVEQALKKAVVKPVKVIGVVRKRKWYENFRWFISSDGFLVVGGRDASQNEALVRKWMKPNDIFIHAEIHGGPAVIVKCEGKPVSEQTLREAAQLAVSYSRAWAVGLEAASAYWVYGSQVSKKPPSGEYLAKGAFMVYGKRNYLHDISLRIAVGVKFEEGVVQLLAGPPSAVSRFTSNFVVLAPGSLDRDVAAKKVKSLLLERCSEAAGEYLKKLSISDIASLMPKGGFRIIR
ncbi:MAG: hypothetical protein DRJ26_05305 [Candidatus Methanomethylicota archaeon]|uniref:NFACT RNA-binding domain-containing protein n=1 Tax=Thermoproteota archaeon TaxID=2056631 RepID=A0A497EXN8_9CREN|nr:MAG: hypothetical protein DRJ26_05305 [Candidatus Verstraetearchaeota archaeon]